MNFVFNNDYQGKTVLVTGHTGFKGSWLSIWLDYLGAKVVGYALEPETQPNMFEAAGVDRRLTSIIGDVRDEQYIEDIVKTYQPDIVFHLAAQPIVRLSYENPRETYETNMMGTVNLLEAVRKNKCVKACVVITSDKCYENREWIYGYRENDSLGGYDPYSSSKAGAELVAQTYRQSYFNPSRQHHHPAAIATARAGNVIGGGDWAPDRILPDAIQAIAANQPIMMRNPGAVRPWQHVLEPLAGYLWLGSLMLSNNINYSSAWNFGPDNMENIDVAGLVDRVIKQWGSGQWQCSHPNEDWKHEMNYLKLDCTKAKTSLNWYSIYGLDEAIKTTVEWYKAFYDQKETSVYDLTLDQIKNYTNRAREMGAVWTAGQGEFDER